MQWSPEQSTDGWVGGLADLEGLQPPDETWCSCKGERRGFKRSHLPLPPHMLNGSIAASQILLLSFSSGPLVGVQFDPRGAPARSHCCSSSYSSSSFCLNEPVSGILQFTLGSRCRAVSSILFILAAAVDPAAGGRLVGI